MLVVDPDDVDAGDMDVDVVRHRLAVHLRAKDRILEDQVVGNDAGAQDVAHQGARLQHGQHHDAQVRMPAREEFEQFRLELRNQSAVGHLLEVAAGLDSQMVGETEIFGQVKDAYAAAQARGATGAVLNRIFQKAFQSAKMARTQTGITEGQISVANVAVELAANIFGNLDKTRVLLLGAGDIGEKTAKAFRSRGAGSLVVASRRMERAMELAAELGANDGRTTLAFRRRLAGQAYARTGAYDAAYRHMFQFYGVGIPQATDPMEMQRKMMDNEFSLEDFRDQLKSLRKLGSLESILKMMPQIGPMKDLQKMSLDMQQCKSGKTVSLLKVSHFPKDLVLVEIREQILAQTHKPQ